MLSGGRFIFGEIVVLWYFFWQFPVVDPSLVATNEINIAVSRVSRLLNGRA